MRARKTTWIGTLILAAGLVWATGCTGNAGDDDDSASPATATWTGGVQSILSNHCSCHTGNSSYAPAWLDEHATVSGTASNSGACSGTVAACIPARIEDGSMPESGACPPGNDGCISQSDFELVQAWVAAGAPE